MAHIVEAYAQHAGLNSEQFSGHSLRAGAITSAAEAGAALFEFQEHSRYKTLDGLRGYERREDPLKNHTMDGVL